MKEELRAARIHIERDLCVRTGPELAKEYSDSTSQLAFRSVKGFDIGDIIDTHNPIWYYANKVWFDTPAGQALLHPPRHRDEMAADLLSFALGEMDEYDGLHEEAPRRGLKSSWARVFTDWIFKRHKLVDGLDITLFYWRYEEREARACVYLVKRKNRYHPYITTNFARDFALPDGPWGTKSQYSWPCRPQEGSVAEEQVNGFSFHGGKAGRGANYHIFDDIEIEKHRSSEALRNELFEEMEQARELKAPPFTRFAHICTAYHSQGLVAYERKATKMTDAGYTMPRFFTRLSPAATADPSEENAVSRFPTIPSLTMKELRASQQAEIDRTGSDTFFQLQKMLNIKGALAAPMKWEWISELDLDGLAKLRHRGRSSRFVLLDTAWKGEQNKGTGCRTVIGVVEIIMSESRYDAVLLDAVANRDMDSADGALQVCRLSEKWDAHLVYPEQKSEKGFEGTLKLAARDTGANLTIITEVTGKGKVSSDKNKDTRASAFAAACKQGRVHILHQPGTYEIGCRWILKEEVDSYPESFTRDFIDMFGMAFGETIQIHWAPPIHTRKKSRFEEEEEEEAVDPATGAPLLSTRDSEERYTQEPGGPRTSLYSFRN